MTKRNNNLGKVVWGKTRFIENDTKPRRRYVVTKDNGYNIGVSKINSVKQDKFGNYIVDNKKIELQGSYSGIPKRSAVDYKVFTKNRKTKEKLSLSKGNGVFDEKEVCVLDDNDLARVVNHVRYRTGTKHQKKF